MESNTEIVIVVVLIVVLLLILIYKKMLKKNDKKNRDIDKNKDINKIKKTLEDIYERIHFDYTRYYLFILSNNLNLSDDDMTTIYGKYPKKYSYPLVDWNKEFEFTNNALSVSSEIDNFIKIKSSSRFCKEKEYNINCFEKLAELKAKENAIAILKESFPNKDVYK